jgi:hypothetical protein
MDSQDRSTLYWPSTCAGSHGAAASSLAITAGEGEIDEDCEWLDTGVGRGGLLACMIQNEALVLTKKKHESITDLSRVLSMTIHVYFMVVYASLRKHSVLIAWPFAPPNWKLG